MFNKHNNIPNGSIKIGKKDKDGCELVYMPRHLWGFNYPMNILRGKFEWRFFVIALLFDDDLRFAIKRILCKRTKCSMERSIKAGWSKKALEYQAFDHFIDEIENMRKERFNVSCSRGNAQDEAFNNVLSELFDTDTTDATLRVESKTESKSTEQRPWLDLSKIKAPELKDVALIAINGEGRFRLEDWQPTTQEEAMPPTDAQVTYLERHGFDRSGWKKGYASRVIDIMVKRTEQGLATPRMVRCLLKNGYPRAHSMSSEDAKRAMDELSQKWNRMNKEKGRYGK